LISLISEAAKVIEPWSCQSVFTKETVLHATN
jgi:hypothetical protein